VYQTGAFKAIFKASKTPRRVTEVSPLRGSPSDFLSLGADGAIRLQPFTSVEGKGPVIDIALLHDEHVLKSALQSRKWQLIGMS